jgi:hypothetical protein
LLPTHTICTPDTTIDPIRRQKLLAYKGPGSLHCKNQILQEYSLRNDMSFDDTSLESTPTHILFSDLLKPLFWAHSFLLRTMIENFLLTGDNPIVIESITPFDRPDGTRDKIIRFIHRDVLEQKYRDAGC